MSGKMKIFSYAGAEPTVIAAELQKEMLEIMRNQLKLMEQMTLTIVLVPQGTKITQVGSGGEVME